MPVQASEKHVHYVGTTKFFDLENDPVKGHLSFPGDWEFAEVLNWIIQKQEGGFKLWHTKGDNDGGWTFAGVTAKTFNAHAETLGEYAIVEPEDFVELWDSSEADRNQIMVEIHDIYVKQYVEPLDLPEVPLTVRVPLLSCAINCGTTTALRLLGSASKHYGFPRLDTFVAMWLDHYDDLIVAKPAKFHQFAKGWRNRTQWFLDNDYPGKF